jgi:hypothetical protein
MKLTAAQIRKKYTGKYISIAGGRGETNDKGETLYTVLKSYKEIRENTLRGEDIETSLAYTR